MIRIVNSLYSTWQSICVIHILHALYIICSIWACYAVGPLIIVRQKTKRQKTFFPKNVFWAWKAEVIGGQKTEIHRKTKCLFVFKDRNREWKTFLHNGASLIVIHTDEQHRAQWFIVSSIGELRSYTSVAEKTVPSFFQFISHSRHHITHSFIV